MDSKIYFNNEGRLTDVVIIRSLAIVMVVFFHAYYMMMVEGHFPASKDVYHGMYYNINCLILQFRMPLFIMISGYLFSYLENFRGKYKGFRALFTNKFKRLIIPFFVFATVFMLSINDFSWRPYYAWGYSHLWFIPMLFWCFIFTRLLSFISVNNKWWFKTIVFGISFCAIINIIPHIQTPLLGIPNFTSWYFWFYLGYQLLLNRDKVYRFIHQHQTIYSIVMLAGFAAATWAKCTIIANDSVRTWYTESGNVMIIFLIWYWINYLIFNKLLEGGGKHLEYFNRHAYGIYVFHNWLQPFMISTTATALFGLDILAAKHTVLFPLIFSISSLLFSFGITWMLLKTRVGRFLIG